MGYALQITKLRTIVAKTYDDCDIQAHEVRIQTLFSGISAGTEMTAYLGTNPYLTKQWNGTLHIFEKMDIEVLMFSYPMDAIGYEEVGKIVELGSEVEGLHESDII